MYSFNGLYQRRWDQRRSDKVTSSTCVKIVINIPKHHVTKLYSKTVPNLELFPYLGKKSNESFITPACSNTTKDFSSKLMGWMDFVKAINYI